MDIDKVYLMGVNINKLGMYQHWSTFKDFSTPELAELSYKLPVPNQIELITEDTPQKPGTTQVQINIGEGNPILNEFINNWYNSFANRDRVTRLNSIINILNYLNTNNSFEVSTEIAENDRFNSLISRLNRHNLHELTNEEAQNIIARNIRLVSSDPRNMVLAYSPIDKAMKLFTDKLKELNTGEQYLNPWDGYSKFMVQKSNSDGKRTVGIMANGIKVFFALSQYFNQYYKNKQNIGPYDNGYFLRHLNINGKNVYASTIADTKISDQILEAFKNELYLISPEAMQNGRNIMKTNDNASLVISALISLATDNAKELALAKMNATIDLASMHIFLAILGFSPKDIVEYTTSPLFKRMAEDIKKNIFLGQDGKIDKAFWDNLNNWAKKHNVSYEQFEQLRQIYYSAREITGFARLLSINQGVKNDIEKASGYLNNFATILSGRMTQVFTKLKDYQLDQLPLQLADILILEKGLQNTPQLREIYIQKITQVNKKLKEYNMQIFDNVDMSRYFKDKDYRDFITSLYDLVKSNFNTYDIINNLPNFYNMIRSFSMSIDRLTSISAKANVSLKQGNKLYQSRLVDNTDIYSDPEYPRVLFKVPQYYTTSMLRSAQRFVDDYIISSFLKSGYIQDNYKIKVTTSGEAGKTYSVDFTTNEDLKQFKDLINYIVIPKLKSIYPENSLLSNLIMRDLNRGRGEKDMRWVFKFDVRRLNSNYDILKYNDIIQGFDELINNNITLGNLLNGSNISVKIGNDIKVEDLLYLYDTALNLSVFGNNSLSLMFDNYISKAELPMQLMQHYTEYDLKHIPMNINTEAFTYYMIKNQAGNRNVTVGNTNFSRQDALVNLKTLKVNNTPYINTEMFITAMKNNLLEILNIECG